MPACFCIYLHILTNKMAKKSLLSTVEVAKLAGVHKDTLLRWLRTNQISEPGRDRRGWRVFTSEEADAVVRFATQPGQPSSRVVKETPATYGFSAISKLSQIDWSFRGATTDYLTHGIHPYPAKFIPQIPNALIQELSSVGDTVLDLFCGSGTTLAEAILLKRNAIGIDASPLACLISRAKTTRLTSTAQEELRVLEERIDQWAGNLAPGQLSLFRQSTSIKPVDRPNDPRLEFWFEPFIIDELTTIRQQCHLLSSAIARDLALTAFSAIIIGVSRQDSDTRYVRREKNILPGDAVRRFRRALGLAIKKTTEFTDATESRFACVVHEANVLTRPNIGQAVDLMVCSPPYPNAYSYHLYHMTRMIWLGMDQPSFKQAEIGSHRKYSRKGVNGATSETFRAELHTILEWLRGVLRRGGYACFVIGNSTLHGQVVDNSELLIGAGEQLGFSVAGVLDRRMQDEKKSFNPAIGKIKTEHIVILRNGGGHDA
jgi:DNA modification methylase